MHDLKMQILKEYKYKTLNFPFSPNFSSSKFFSPIFPTFTSISSTPESMRQI